MKTIARNQLGQGLTEYLILMLLISVASIVAAQKLGTVVKNKLEHAKTRIENMDRKGGGPDDGDG